MKQKPFSASLVGGGQERADATPKRAVRCAEETDLLLNALISFKARQVGRERIKSTDEGMEWLRAGAQTENGPGATVSTATQRRNQACIDDRRLPAAKTAHKRDNAMLAELAQEFLN